MSYYRSDCTSYITRHKQDPPAHTHTYTHCLDGHALEHGKEQETPGRASRESAGQRERRTKKIYSNQSAQVFFSLPSYFFSPAGSDYRVVHISFVMDVGVAEVVPVDGSIYHVKSLQPPCNQGKTTPQKWRRWVGGGERGVMKTSPLWNTTAKFQGWLGRFRLREGREES